MLFLSLRPTLFLVQLFFVVVFFVCSVALGVLFLFAVFFFGIVTAAGLCTGPIPVHSCGPLPMAAICMHQLVNLPVLCNMQSNVLNDLAKAKRRWTEKKSA